MVIRSRISGLMEFLTLNFCNHWGIGCWFFDGWGVHDWLHWTLGYGCDLITCLDALTDQLTKIQKIQLLFRQLQWHANADLGEKHGVFGCVDAGPHSAKHIIGNQERCLRLNHTNLDIPTGQRHKQGILATTVLLFPKRKTVAHGTFWVFCAITSGRQEDTATNHGLAVDQWQSG